MPRFTNSVSSSSTLPPEYARALRALCDRFDPTTCEIRTTSSPVTEEVWQNESFTVYDYEVPAKAIPSDSHWRWNQTKSRKEASLDDAKTSFFKLCPRKRLKRGPLPRGCSLPSYKLWMFEVTLPDQPTLFALWCEKGDETKAKAAELTVIPKLPRKRPPVLLESPPLSGPLILDDFINSDEDAEAPCWLWTPSFMQLLDSQPVPAIW